MSGVFVFDMWVREVRNSLTQAKIALQYHDELMFVCLRKDKEIVDSIVKKAMETVNNKLKLNVNIEISVEWGNNYAECH